MSRTLKNWSTRRINTRLVHKEHIHKEFLVFENEYKHFSNKELDDTFKEIAKKEYCSSNIFEAKNYAQLNYAMNHGSNLSKEMARSVGVALRNRSGGRINYEKVHKEKINKECLVFEN